MIEKRLHLKSLYLSQKRNYCNLGDDGNARPEAKRNDDRLEHKSGGAPAVRVMTVIAYSQIILDRAFITDAFLCGKTVPVGASKL